MNNFCIKGEKPFECKQPVFKEFEDEITIMTLILEYFKRYLPELMIKKLDCYNEPIQIDPNDIGVTVQKDYGSYVLVLVPTEDTSSYSDDLFMLEDSEYGFDLQMSVRHDDSEGALENLIKLKSGVKTMLVNMDHNLGLNTVIEGFSYEGPFDIENSNKVIRAGSYRFSVTDKRFKN